MAVIITCVNDRELLHDKLIR